MLECSVHTICKDIYVYGAASKERQLHPDTLATTKQGLSDVRLMVINHHCKHIIICGYWGNMKVEL